MKEELFRKLVHLSSLIYPFLYYVFFTKYEMILLLFIITLTVIIGDVVRLKTTFLNKIFHIMLRESEKKGGLSGATFFMIGTLITVSCFSKIIAIIAICVLVISDTAAAIFGKLIPSKKIIDEKSIAGTLAFFITSVCIVLFFQIPLLIIACFFTTIIELYAKRLKIDDNILIPLSFASLSYILLLF